MFIHWV